MANLALKADSLILPFSSNFRCSDVRRNRFFHATGSSVNMQVNERLKFPYKTLIGFTLAVVSTLILGIFGCGG